MLRERYTVTSFLESENEVLILLRSEHVSTYPGRWAGISGSIEGENSADEQVLVEIEQETGLHIADIQLVKKGEPLVIDDIKLGLRKIVYPYLFHVRDRSKISIDWEHKEIRWIKQEDIDNYETMPKLRETLAKVLSL
ncbi:NUDIX domain-containing protein [Chloroflexota bacterium]